MATTNAEKDAFAQKIQSELRRSAPQETWHYDVGEFRLVFAGHNGSVFNLAPAFEHYRAVPFWGRTRFIKQRVAVFCDILAQREPSLAEARPLLRPKIRERILLQMGELQAQRDGRKSITPAYRVLGEHLTLEVAIDFPNTIRGVSAENLEEWNMTLDEALDIASANILNSGSDRFRQLRTGVYVSAWNDQYDCSRMHLPSVIGSVHVKGRPVAMIPNRDTLIITGADDEQGVLQMAKMATDILGKPGAMSGFAFRLDDVWRPFLPETDHAGYALLKQLATETWAQYCSQMADLLERANAKAGLDIYVCRPVIGTDSKSRIAMSVGTWIEGVDTLFPETDRVAFLRPEPGGPPIVLGSLPWNVVKTSLGHLLEEQEGYPTFFRSRTFPSAETFADLGLEPFKQ